MSHACTGLTEIVTLFVGVVPPEPVQAIEYVVVDAGVTDIEPLVARDWLHPPVPVQDVALVEDHVSIELAPGRIDVGLAENVTVGNAGGAADTVIL